MGIKDRKEREKETRREQIKIAAKEVFMLKGFHSATMEDIADKSELSPATIYLYFKNKEELFASLILSPMRYMLEETEKVYNNEKLSVEEKILEFKEVMYKTYQYDPLMLHNLFHLQIENALWVLRDELFTEINDTARKLHRTMANIFADGVRQGKFVEANPMSLMDIIWGTFTGLVMWEEAKTKFNPSKDYLKPTLDRAFSVFLEGIKRR
jgi:AcrR family transcriptional regulator